MVKFSSSTWTLKSDFEWLFFQSFFEYTQGYESFFNKAIFQPFFDRHMKSENNNLSVVLEENEVVVLPLDDGSISSVSHSQLFSFFSWDILFVWKYL